MPTDAPTVLATHPLVVALDRLGDEIAELSAHLDAATARLLQVVVHVDAPVLADPDQPGQSVLEDGTHVPAGTSRRLTWGAPLK